MICFVFFFFDTRGMDNNTRSLLRKFVGYVEGEQARIWVSKARIWTQRPISWSQRPGFEFLRPGSGSQRPDPGSQRPESGSRGQDLSLQGKERVNGPVRKRELIDL